MPYTPLKLPACPPLKITFLGTGTSSGVPMIGCNCPVCVSKNKHDQRLRTSLLIQSASTTVVIDATPDFRYQMLRANVKTLDAIVFTHPHKDHIGGLDDVRAYNYFSNKPMPLYANALTQKGIKNDFHYAFTNNTLLGLPKLQMVPIGNAPFMVGNIPFVPINVLHYKMPVLGFKVGKLAYITDANFIAPTELQKCEGAEILVINTLRNEKHLSHFTLAEAVAIGQQLKVKKMYGTHISHQLGKHVAVNKTLPKWCTLAYDCLCVNV